MSEKQTFFDWEDDFDSLKNIEADVYVNDSLKKSDIHFDKIKIYRSGSNVLNIIFFTKESFHSDLIKREPKPYNFKIEIKLKQFSYSNYSSILLCDANFGPETIHCIDNFVETKATAKRVVYMSSKPKLILKEWYGCRNNLNFHNGILTSKTTEEIVTYKNQNSV